MNKKTQHEECPSPWPQFTGFWLQWTEKIYLLDPVVPTSKAHTWKWLLKCTDHRTWVCVAIGAYNEGRENKEKKTKMVQNSQ